VIAVEHEMSSSLLAAYGAMLVALVAGAFSLLGLVVSKENKVSEFRQEWIDALREDIAEFVAQSQEIHVELVEYISERVKDYSEHLQRTRDSRIALNKAATRTKLRLNQAEIDNEPLMKAMKRLQDLLEDPDRNVESFRGKFGPVSVEVEKNAAMVLAREWKRVKEGERGYRRAKVLAYTALLTSLAAALLLSKTVGR
jgi:chromosome segregation ATPase